jgi:hypothetical protein
MLIVLLFQEKNHSNSRSIISFINPFYESTRFVGVRLRLCELGDQDRDAIDVGYREGSRRVRR